MDMRGRDNTLLYRLNDIPPWYVCLILGAQHYLTMFGGTFTLPFLVARSACMLSDLSSVSNVISSTFLVMGISTLLQSTLGTRLPIIQGSTPAILVPALAIAASFGQCPSTSISPPTNYPNDTSTSIKNVTLDTEVNLVSWQIRVRTISGTLAVSSLFQIVLSFIGVSRIIRYISPVTIAPTIALIGLALVDVALDLCKGQWWVSIGACLLVVVFANYVNNVEVPLPAFTRRKRFHVIKAPVFGMFPMMLSIGIMWLVCFVLTSTNALPDSPDQWGYTARTDVRQSVIDVSPWIRAPYPTQFGIPAIDATAVIAMITGIIASIVESIGDYYVAAQFSGAPPPPSFAINRGILIEGIGCGLSGLFGCGVGTTSYSENVAALAITKVGSRRVIQCSACFMIIFGFLPKAGSVFVTVPDPVYGGVFLMMFAMVTGVGLSNLQHVDLTKTRNAFIVGFSLFMGLIVPRWIKSAPGQIQFGADSADKSVEMLLSMGLFVGAIIAFILDNTIAGSDEERGITSFRDKPVSESAQAKLNRKSLLIDNYELPALRRFARKFPLVRYCSLFPKYDEESQGDPDVDQDIIEYDNTRL